MNGSLEYAKALPEAKTSLPSTMDRIDTDLLPEAFFRQIDLASLGIIARLAGGTSPVAWGLAMADWALHLALAPGKRAELSYQAGQAGLLFLSYVVRTAMDENTAPCIEPAPTDDRLADPSWDDLPYRIYKQGFLLAEQWWNQASRGVIGVSPLHEQMLGFVIGQWLETLSPANCPWTNPSVAGAIRQWAGFNFLTYTTNGREDMYSLLAEQTLPGGETFEVDRDLDCWVRWLDRDASATLTAPLAVGAPACESSPLNDPPGTYGLQS